jgi:hypothetical protein
MAAKAPGPLLRWQRVIARPVMWPLKKLIRRRVRRDPRFAAMWLGMQVDLCSRELGPNHMTTLRNRHDHAVEMLKLGELQEAEAELADVITRLGTLDDSDAGLLLVAARLWHGQVLRKLGRAPEPEADAG